MLRNMMYGGQPQFTFGLRYMSLKACARNIAKKIEPRSSLVRDTDNIFIMPEIDESGFTHYLLISKDIIITNGISYYPCYGAFTTKPSPYEGRLPTEVGKAIDGQSMRHNIFINTQN